MHVTVCRQQQQIWIFIKIAKKLINNLCGSRWNGLSANIFLFFYFSRLPWMEMGLPNIYTYVSYFNDVEKLFVYPVRGDSINDRFFSFPLSLSLPLDACQQKNGSLIGYGKVSFCSVREKKTFSMAQFDLRNSWWTILHFFGAGGINVYMP